MLDLLRYPKWCHPTFCKLSLRSHSLYHIYIPAIFTICDLVTYIVTDAYRPMSGSAVINNRGRKAGFITFTMNDAALLYNTVVHSTVQWKKTPYVISKIKEEIFTIWVNSVIPLYLWMRDGKEVLPSFIPSSLMGVTIGDFATHQPNKGRPQNATMSSDTVSSFSTCAALCGNAGLRRKPLQRRP